MNRERERNTRTAPGRGGYVLGVVFMALGFAAMVAFMLPRLQALGDEMTRVVVPGEAEMNLAEPGQYTIFHESRSTLDGTVYVSSNITGLKVAVTALETGKALKLEASSANMSYSVQGRSGVSLFSFEVPAPGRYRLTAAYDDARKEPRAVLAVGSGFMGKLLTTIFGAIGFAFAGMAAGALTIVRTWRARKRALGER